VMMLSLAGIPLTAGFIGKFYVIAAGVEAQLWWLLGAAVSGYAFAWVGHFGFEKNRPATFRHPIYSLMGDWVMYRDIWTGKIPF